MKASEQIAEIEKRLSEIPTPKAEDDESIKIFIVGDGLPLRDKERMIAHLELLKSEIAKQASVYIVDSVDDVPKGAESFIVRFQQEQEVVRQFELKVPEETMLSPVGRYNDGKTNRRERRRKERELRKKGRRI